MWDGVLIAGVAPQHGLIGPPPEVVLLESWVHAKWGSCLQSGSKGWCDRQLGPRIAPHRNARRDEKRAET